MLKRENLGHRHCLTRYALENKLYWTIIADLGIIFLRRSYLIHWYQILHPHIVGSMPFRFYGPPCIWPMSHKEFFHDATTDSFSELIFRTFVVQGTLSRMKIQSSRRGQELGVTYSLNAVLESDSSKAQIRVQSDASTLSGPRTGSSTRTLVTRTSPKLQVRVHSRSSTGESTGTKVRVLGRVPSSKSCNP